MLETVTSVYSTKGKKMECFRDVWGSKLEPTWMNHGEILFWQLLGPLWTNAVEHSWKPAQRKNKDKHSCQPPASLFQRHHTYLLHESSYIHAKVLADWWLTQRLLMLVCGFACTLWGLKAAHETLWQYWPHGFIVLFDSQYQTDHKKDSFKPFSFNRLILSCWHSADFSSRENPKSRKLQMNTSYLHNSGDNCENR